MSVRLATGTRGASMAFTKVHHVKYSVGDLDRSLTFYRDLLGFEVTYEAARKGLHPTIRS